MDLLALPQFDWRLAAFDKRKLHNVKDEDEFRDRQDRQHGTEGKADPQDELIEDQAEAGVGDVELREVVLVGIRSIEETSFQIISNRRAATTHL